MNSIKIESIRKPPVNLSKEDKSLFEHEYYYKYDVKEPYIINDVTIVDDYIFTQKNVLLKETNINFHNSFNNSLKTRLKFVYKKTVYKKKRYKCAVWVLDSWSLGYFHWMTDVLQRIIEAKKKNINAPILLPENYKNYTYVTESLTFLNTDVVYYKTNEIKFIDELYYIPIQSTTGNYNEHLIQILRQKLLLMSDSKTKPFDKIYISRKYAPKKKIINEDDLIAVLKKHKFKIIYFERLSFTDQIKIANKASVMVSIHGAGLTNMLFMNDNTKVLELRMENDKTNNCYFSLASALNIDYYYLKCKSTSNNTWDADFFVDIDKLEKLLNKL